MLARLDPRFLDASGSRSANRRRTQRARRPSAPGSPPHAAPRARRRASSQATTTAFLARHRLPVEAGAIVDEDGRELGTHEGFWRFTPGQRRGLGVSASEPLYAVSTDAATNTVVVGPRAALATTT